MLMSRIWLVNMSRKYENENSIEAKLVIRTMKIGKNKGLFHNFHMAKNLVQHKKMNYLDNKFHFQKGRDKI